MSAFREVGDWLPEVIRKVYAPTTEERIARLQSENQRLTLEVDFANRRIDRLRALAGRLRYELTGRHDARRSR